MLTPHFENSTVGVVMSWSGRVGSGQHFLMRQVV